MSVENNVPEIRFNGFSGEWEEYPLSTFINSMDAGVSVNSGDRPANESEFGILKTSCVTNGFFEPNENKIVFKAEEINRLKEPVLENTIIISRMNTPALVGANAYIGKGFANFFLPDRLWAAKPTSVGDLKFIAYILGSDKGRLALSELATGTSGSMKNISKASVLRLKFRAPLDQEQTQIGNTFQKLDNLIKQHQQKHDKLNSIKKAMLEKMFPKQGEATPEIRFKGFSGEWEEVALGEYAIFTKGQGYSKSDLSDSGTPIILYGRLYTKYQTVIDQVDTFAIEKSKSVKSVGNEVIVPASGESSEDIARASAVCESGVILGGDLNIIYPNDKINPVFLALVISNGYPQKALASKAQGKSVVHIRNRDLAALLFTMPKKEEQTAIGNYFQKLDMLINQHQQQITKLNNIKQACLRKMFV